MFREDRLAWIKEKIISNEKITVEEICQEYGISEESARRDLRLLDKEGVCHRTRGGAIAKGQVSVRPPLDRDFSKMQIFDNYRDIAKKAVSMIKENDTVYITGGSFGYIMTTMLPRDIHFTVIVNSIDVAKEMRQFENIDVYVAGGKMRQSGSLTDSLASEFVSRIHCDICFITGSGLTADFGLTNGTDETATFQRTVMKNSRKKCLLIPGKKIGENSFIKVCDVENFDCIITDGECDEEELKALGELGVEILVTEE